MKHTNLRFAIFLVVAIILSSTAFFFFPALQGQGLSLSLAVAFFTTFVLFGAVWYFLSSLRTFKIGLKVAYYLLAAGIVFYSLLLPQVFLTLLVDLDIFWRNGLYLAPYGLATVLAYLGMRKFANLLEIRGWWNNFWLVLLLAAVVGLGATQLPHSDAFAALGVPESSLDLIMGILTGAGFFGAAATAIAFQVRKTISQNYKAAMGWTGAALLMVALSALHEVVTKIYFFDSAYTVSDWSSSVFILTGILFLRAGLAFKPTAYRSLQLPTDASYIDIVVAAANLVSRPNAVDAELDKLRQITARTSDPQALTKEDKTTLTNLYKYLEEYLITKEPLSNFTQEGLRDNLPEQFVAELK